MLRLYLEMSRIVHEELRVFFSVIKVSCNCIDK